MAKSHVLCHTTSGVRSRQTVVTRTIALNQGESNRIQRIQPTRLWSTAAQFWGLNSKIDQRGRMDPSLESILWDEFKGKYWETWRIQGLPAPLRGGTNHSCPTPVPENSGNRESLATVPPRLQVPMGNSRALTSVRPSRRRLRCRPSSCRPLPWKRPLSAWQAHLRPFSWRPSRRRPSERERP